MSIKQLAKRRAVMNTANFDFNSPMTALPQRLVDLKASYSRSTVKNVLQYNTASTNLFTYSEDFSNASWTKRGFTPTYNYGVAPDGTTTSTLITIGAAGVKDFYQNPVYPNDINAVPSIYIKRVSTTGSIYVVNPSGGNGRVVINLATIGSGWVRVYFGCPEGTSQVQWTGFSNGCGLHLFTPSGDTQIEVWGAMMDKGSTINPYIKTSGSVTTTYAPSVTPYLVPLKSQVFGTSYNPVDGKYGYLPEEAATNKCLYSDAFTYGSWVKSNSSIVSTNNIGPTGQTIASLLQVTTSGGFISQAFTATAAQHTYSVYVKKGNTRYVYVGMLYNADDNGCVFDLDNNGVVTATIGTITNTSAVNLGNGWLRLSITKTLTAASWLILVTPTSTSDTSVTRANGDNIYLWGAQLETGGRPSSYVSTLTSTVSRGADVLSVPLWINNATYSQDWSTGGVLNPWSSNSGTLINATLSTSGTAPDGTATAILATVTATSATHTALKMKAPSTTCTVSIYVKKGSNTTCRLLLSNTTTTTNFTSGDLNFDTGVITGSGWTATYDGNGWFRCSYTQSTGINVGNTLSIYYFSRGGSLTAGDTQYVWGAQLEPGSTMTSYKPTTSTLESVANRNVPLFNSTGYTLFCDMGRDALPITSKAVVAITSQANNVSYMNHTPTAYGALVITVSVSQASATYVTTSLSRIKTALSVTTNAFSYSTNGVNSGTDLSVTMPLGLFYFEIGNLLLTSQTNGYIYRASLIPKALTQSELNGLTTL